MKFYLGWTQMSSEVEAVFHQNLSSALGYQVGNRVADVPRYPASKLKLGHSPVNWGLEQGSE